MKKNLLFILSLSLFLFNACKKSTDDPKPIVDPVIPPPTTTPYTPDNSFKIVAYMPSYRDPGLIADQKYKMITHLLYAFLRPNPTADGSVTLESAANFAAIRQKAKDNHVKFGVSVSAAESVFAAIAASTSARATFIRNLVTFATANKLDGIDIDWEYPRTVNSGPSTDFTRLMQELSTELHREGLFLSAAITPGVYASTNRDAIEAAAYTYVDFFNIMQYDGPGYDTAEPLNHASLKMTDASLNFWLNTKGMPKDKAILGIPLYGKSASGSSIGFRDIEASGADITQNVATVNGTAYGFNGTALVKTKAQRAKDRCNGIMFWEFAHDSNTTNSLIKAANDQLGRAY